jgi:hypothetical protein
MTFLGLATLVAAFAWLAYDYSKLHEKVKLLDDFADVISHWMDEMEDEVRKGE